MSYNIPEEERPQANKKAQEGLNILTSDVNSTLNRVKNLQQGTIVDEYNKPVDAPMARTLSPIEQYIYEPQPVAELGSVSEPIAEESMAVPQDQPKVLSNFVNQYESVPQRDMVSVTPYEQAVVDLRRDQVDSLRNDAGEISSSSLEVFSKPLDANKVKVLGFVDDEMKPTKKGELFYNLKNMGMFNDDGTITEKGIAYMTPLDEMAVPEWIEQPGNVEKFDLLWKDGVIRSSSTPTEILGSVTKFAGDVVYGAGELAQQQALGLAYNSRTWGGLLGLEDNRPAALKAQSEVSELSVMENVYKNVVNLATMVDVGFATDKKLIEEYVMSPIGAAYEKVTGDEFPELRATDRSNPNVKDSEDALIAARHKQWAANQRLADMEAGEIAETFLGVENSVKQAESLKKQIGDDEFKKIYGGVGAFTSVALDPTNAVPVGFAVKASRAAPLASRALLNAQKTMGKVAAMELAIAQGDVAVQAARATLAKVEPTVGLANRMAQSFAERAKVQPNLVEKSQTAANIARRVTDEANQIKSALPAITAELEGLIAKRNSLATRIPEAYSQKVLQTMAIGRQARALPAKALGATLEGVGDTISKADTAITNFLQERGLDQIYTAAVGAAGVVGMAGSPVIGTVAAGAAALKSGKVLSSYGKLFRYVGKEMENVRGQIPFWKRVAAHTAPGSLGRGIAHTFNAFDLGGVTSDTIRRTGRGIVAAAPSDIMFEYLSDGADMRPETLYQAGAESFVIGGSFAAAGGAFMGTKKRMRELSIGDEINFRSNLIDPRQKALFQAIPSSTRRAISTYAIANPTLNYVFKDSGVSRYDPNTNTASINVNSTNPIKALVAHETLHHTIIKNNMEAGIAALFLGDTKGNAAGGLFRSKDGTLDPNFEAFKNAYYKRLGADGMTNAERDAIYPLDKIAVEYFIEKHADQYASMAESGALGAVSSSGAARRKLGSILETVLPRVPVLKDLHFKSGGMIDANGSWVTGNGLLDAEGVRRDPITSKMFRDMNRRSSGLAPGQFDPLMSDKPDSGAPILLDPANGIDAELLHPLINVDANGKPILQNGKPVALDRATELSRALGGITAIEAMRRKRAENYAPEKGEAHIDSEGEFQPGWLSNDVITEMFAKNNYNSEQKRIIREMNRLIKKGAGERVVMINFPATGRNKAGKVVYKSQEATLRDTVPVAVTISKTGNLLFGLMSVTKLNENIQKRAQSKRGKKLYGGNVDLILRDTQAMMDFHKNGVDSIEFFKEKYGAVEADERKKFINTMFGLLNKKEQAVLNPMLLEDGVKSRDNVYRTYRADRVSKAVPMSPEEYPAMPFSYEAVSQVKMPEQARQMPEPLPEDYRGEHTAPGPEGAPASDLTGGGVYPSDVYSRPDWYEQDEGLAEMRKIARLKGNPEAPVWIHRAVPADVAKKAMKSDYPLGYIFRSGDWVTTNKQYAKDHGESVFKGNYEVFSKRVKAKDIHTNGDSIFEWGYNPETSEVASNKSSNIRYMPEPVSSPAKKKKEIVEQEDKGIQAPTGSLGELRSNVEIKKSNLPADTLSVPKFVARENKDSDWKVMEGPLRIARGNYFTPLPNIKIKKTNEFSVQNQNLVQNAFLAKSKTPTDPKALREQQNAIRNTNASLDKIGLAVRDIEADPQKFVDPKGYAEVMKKAGVTGDVLIPPSSLKMMLEDPDAFTALLSGGYHGDKTVAGIRESAMSGLDSVVEMRELIGGRPPDLVTAIHHLWGTLSKQLPPLQQEALWMRMITNKEVMQQIGESINGTFSQSPSQWKDTVKKARINTVGNYGKLGNNATSNANSFYLMLYRHNGKWGEVSDVYKNNDAVQMRYDFNTLGHGATGIKNKVQSFIGLTFGIKGNVLDRWRFVDMYLADAMKITGAKTPRDYFKYEGKSKNVPVDKIGIYKNYGTIENKSPLFSLAMYSGMDRVSQAAIDASPSLKALLGNHADPGGLHWLSWNAIKNEAVGHSSLDITKNFIKAYNQDGKFDKLTVDNFLKFVNSTEAFVEGTSGGGEEITRLTLKNGVFNYTKK